MTTPKQVVKTLIDIALNRTNSLNGVTSDDVEDLDQFLESFNEYLIIDENKARSKMAELEVLRMQIRPGQLN